MKNKTTLFLLSTLCISLLSACTAQKQTGEDISHIVEEQTENTASDKTAGQDVQENFDITDITEEQNTQMPEMSAVTWTPVDTGGRPSLIKSAIDYDADSVVPCVEAYTIEPDFSNIYNLWQVYLNDEMKEKLLANGFVVCDDAGSEFFEIYEMNRYDMVPNFVTVDSMMHTYHLYFGHLLKNVEKNYLSDSITLLSKRMLENSRKQYERLRGSEWENAAKRNVAFFTVGANLLDENTAIGEDVADLVQPELDAIRQAEGIDTSLISGIFEDYTQYKPRGYYEGDEKLERYFRAMMWYGRMHFSQDDTDMDRSALLITKAVADDAQAYELWESAYTVTSFFAGASDDLGVCEYAAVMDEVYGSDAVIEDLIGKEEEFERFHAETAKLSAPQINSIPIVEGEDPVILGFRFMGQRFTIDAAVMQKLVFSAVKENSEGDLRMLPDVLDVPAALGSDAALRILEENGDTDYAGYSEHMSWLRESLSKDNLTLWSASLYAGWLNTLRPLLTVKGEGYPMFMQSEEWVKKDLECFAGSFTELKHDTVLYSKQVMAEMGGGYDEEPDDRGYVEPEPLVYARFVHLADATAQGLKEYGMLDAADEENLLRLSQMAEQLFTISNKELGDEILTEEEYEFIRSYGGNLEHFWYEVAKAASASDSVFSRECPAALVVDIATNPNGEVLEAATGNPSLIYVAVKVDGRVKIARGSVYSFYQFAWPLDNRLTDSEWHQMIGLRPDEDGNYNYDIPVQQPEWTDSYRYKYEYTE